MSDQTTTKPRTLEEIRNAGAKHVVAAGNVNVASKINKLPEEQLVVAEPTPPALSLDELRRSGVERHISNGNAGIVDKIQMKESIAAPTAPSMKTIDRTAGKIHIHKKDLPVQQFDARGEAVSVNKLLSKTVEQQQSPIKEEGVQLFINGKEHKIGKSSRYLLDMLTHLED